MIEPTVAAYAAGLIDGDGCIQINRKARKGWSTYGLTVSVSQVQRDCVDWMHRHFGGSVFSYESSKENRQTLYRWSVHCKQAYAVLQVILPFLVEKSERAKVAMKLQEAIVPRYGYKGKSAFRLVPSSDELAYRESLFQSLKVLNRSTGRNHFAVNLKEVN